MPIRGLVLSASFLQQGLGLGAPQQMHRKLLANGTRNACHHGLHDMHSCSCYRANQKEHERV